MKNLQNILDNSPLGQRSPYISTYSPSLLFSIPRAHTREQISIFEPIPFDGVDIWNAYEVSWLNPRGKPMVAMVEFHVPCTSPNLIESKSFKLYFNSLNQSHFDSIEQVQSVIARDFTQLAGAPVTVNVITPQQFSSIQLQEPQGICLDNLEIETDVYHTCPDFLYNEPGEVEETLYSNLLKTNCLVTHQPDWATVSISYTGQRIQHTGLLKYLISFREHNEFHEQCIERIFIDILNYCHPKKLTVFGRYTRRGGIDINPYRSNFSKSPGQFLRSARQ